MSCIPDSNSGCRILWDSRGNNNPNHWWRDDDDVLKIVSLNCAGLLTHFPDIVTDHTLLKADVIHLIETSLQPDSIEEDLNIPGYQKREQSRVLYAVEFRREYFLRRPFEITLLPVH